MHLAPASGQPSNVVPPNLLPDTGDGFGRGFTHRGEIIAPHGRTILYGPRTSDSSCRPPSSTNVHESGRSGTRGTAEARGSEGRQSIPITTVHQTVVVRAIIFYTLLFPDLRCSRASNETVRRIRNRSEACQTLARLFLRRRFPDGCRRSFPSCRADRSPGRSAWRRPRLRLSFRLSFGRKSV